MPEPTQLDRIEALLHTCLDATNTVLSYYEQLAEQYELLRQEHVRNHPNSPSMLPIQMLLRKKHGGE